MVVRELLLAAGDPATQQWLSSSFTVASSLHSNFYEDEADLDEVHDGLETCEMLAERLLALFGTA